MRERGWEPAEDESWRGDQHPEHHLTDPAYPGADEPNPQLDILKRDAELDEGRGSGDAGL